VDSLYAVGDNLSKISTSCMIKMVCFFVIYVPMLRFIIYVIIIAYMFMGNSL
jgi:hypothetical protein